MSNQELINQLRALRKYAEKTTAPSLSSRKSHLNQANHLTRYTVNNPNYSSVEPIDLFEQEKRLVKYRLNRKFRFWQRQTTLSLLHKTRNQKIIASDNSTDTSDDYSDFYSKMKSPKFDLQEYLRSLKFSSSSSDQEEQTPRRSFYFSHERKSPPSPQYESYRASSQLSTSSGSSYHSAFDRPRCSRQSVLPRCGGDKPTPKKHQQNYSFKPSPQSPRIDYASRKGAKVVQLGTPTQKVTAEVEMSESPIPQTIQNETVSPLRIDDGIPAQQSPPAALKIKPKFDAEKSPPCSPTTTTKTKSKSPMFDPHDIVDFSRPFPNRPSTPPRSSKTKTFPITKSPKTKIKPNTSPETPKFITPKKTTTAELSPVEQYHAKKTAAEPTPILTPPKKEVKFGPTPPPTPPKISSSDDEVIYQSGGEQEEPLLIDSMEHIEGVDGDWESPCLLLDGCEEDESSSSTEQFKIRYKRRSISNDQFLSKLKEEEEEDKSEIDILPIDHHQKDELASFLDDALKDDQNDDDPVRTQELIDILLNDNNHKDKTELPKEVDELRSGSSDDLMEQLVYAIDSTESFHLTTTTEEEEHKKEPRQISISRLSDEELEILLSDPSSDDGSSIDQPEDLEQFLTQQGINFARTDSEDGYGRLI